MSTFPTDADTFYQLRDDRTNRCTRSAAYQRVACAITMQQDLLATRTGRILFQVTTNLLARWCRNVTLVVPAPNPLVDEVLSVMHDADPFGTFTTATRLAGSGVHVHLGRECHVFTDQTVVVAAGGWHAWLGTTEPPVLALDDRNVLGAISAACLGVAQAFKIAIAVPRVDRLRSGAFDLFSLSWTDTTTSGLRFPRSLDLGRLLLVGTGSVGSALAYILHLADAAVSMTVVDKDVVGIENLNRSPLFGQRTFGVSKVAAVAQCLSGSTIEVAPFEGWWDEFVATGELGSFDVWLPLANERAVRWSMQQNLPPLMIHASTGVNGGVNFGRHIPGQGDCLVDRFPEPVMVPLACSIGAVQTIGGSVDAALPFASVFAGVLIAADLVRLVVPGYPQVPNLAVLDLGGDLASPILINRIARPECVCRE